MTIIDYIQRNAKQARWTGIALLVIGLLSLMAPLVAGLSIVMLAGVLLVALALLQLALVFRAGSLGNGFALLVLGGLSLVAGISMLVQPGVALATLTLILAAYFVVVGILEMIAAFQARPSEGWGWLFISGIVSLLLGVMIWRQFPLSGTWAIGILVGVRLLTAGWMLMAIGGAARSIAKHVAEPTS